MNNSFISNIDYMSLSAMSLTSVIVKQDADRDFRISFEPSYSGFEDFIFFGSAEVITRHAIDKILETYPINVTGTTASSEYIEIGLKYRFSYSSFERKILEGFSNSVTGTYEGMPFTLKTIPRDISNNNLTDINDINYVDSLILESQLYDDHNSNRLKGFVPFNLIENDEFGNMSNLLDMFGHSFDEIILYTSQFSNLTNVINNYDNETKPRPYDSQNLLRLFGLKQFTSFIFSNLINFLVQTDTRFSQKAIQIEIWDRLLSNLIYIYKTKGTIECIRAFLNALGIDQSIIDIDEYVNFETPSYVKTNKTLRYYEVIFDESDSGNISSSASSFNLTSNEWSMIYMFDLKGKIQTQELFGRGDQYGASIINTSVSSDYNELIESGYVSFTANTIAGSFVLTSNTASDIFINYPKTLIINKSSTGYDLEYSYVDLNMNLHILSASNSVTSSLTSSNSVFYLGRNGLNNDNNFVGSAINFKAFPLSLNSDQKRKYHYSVESINVDTGVVDTFSLSGIPNDKVINWNLNDFLSDAYRVNNFSSITSDSARIITDSSTGFMVGSSTGYANFTNGVKYVSRYITYPTQKYVSGIVPYSDKINTGKVKYKNTNLISFSINPAKYINNSFEYILGPIDFFDYFTSDDLNSNNTVYQGLENLKNKFFSTNISIKKYDSLISDIEDVAVGLFKTFYQFLPAKSKLYYSAVLIENPIYHRNKHIIRNLDFDSNIDYVQRESIDVDIEDKIYSQISDDVYPISIESFKFDSTSGDVVSYEIEPNNIPTLTGEHIYDDENVEIEHGFITAGDSIDDISRSLLYNPFLNDSVGEDENAVEILSSDSTLSISGYDTIYLSDSLTGETDIYINYIDQSGDILMGNFFSIIQNFETHINRFNIIDEISSITASNKSQRFSFSNYDPKKIKFRFSGDFNESVSSRDKIDIVKNKLIIDNREYDFNIKIKWYPDVAIISDSYIIDDAFSHITYPSVHWNLSTEMPTITSAYSDYGSSITSSYFTTSADYVAGSGINIFLQNYSRDKEAEIVMKYTITGQTNLFYVMSESVTSSMSNRNRVISAGYIDEENVVFYKNSNDHKRIILEPMQSIRLSLLLRTNNPASITASTTGEFRFDTNEPLDENRNKKFLLKFYANVGTISESEKEVQNPNIS